MSHVYSPEWGDGSPCSVCMEPKSAHRFKGDKAVLKTVLKWIEDNHPGVYMQAIWETDTVDLVRL